MADVCADLNHNTLEYLPLSDVMVCVTFRCNGTHRFHSGSTPSLV